MTREYISPDGRVELPSEIGRELEQLKRLLPLGLSDDELAHRLVVSKRELKKMKKALS